MQSTATAKFAPRTKILAAALIFCAASLSSHSFSGQPAFAAKAIDNSTNVAAVTPMISPGAVDSDQRIFLDCDSADKSVRAKMAKGVSDVTVKAPKEVVWRLLTDFPNYPRLFPRMTSCAVTKREGSLVYVESYLKPQVMVKQTCQHTINDMAGRPDVLRWKMLDGNFKAVEGEWRLKSSKDGKQCQVRYTLALEPGAAIPKPMAGFVIKMMQREIVNSIKEVAVADYSQSGGKDHVSQKAVAKAN